MGRKWGSAEFKDLIKLRDKLEDFMKNQTLLEDVARELANRLISEVVPRTPVGQYPAGSGRVGGTLRSGWEIRSEPHMDSDTHIVSTVVGSAEIKESGDYYEIWVMNPVEYAKYVELGHRTSNHESWVPGRHMLRISINAVNEIAPKVAEEYLLKELREVFE